MNNSGMNVPGEQEPERERVEGIVVIVLDGSATKKTTISRCNVGKVSRACSSRADARARFV